MGTLFEQPARKDGREDINGLVFDVISIVKEGFDENQAIEILKIAEMRRKNNLYQMNGDIHDEQLSGFGDLLKEFIFIAQRIAENIE